MKKFLPGKGIAGDLAHAKHERPEFNSLEHKAHTRPEMAWYVVAWSLSLTRSHRC
ncbi:hypothetical protein PISMIDRAFT_681058 [Pisolithus microcarpus 441]|uniref:Uncharacterized protein n=1 Tax=Pisolithus microcarpus 441 TaxID=765257 RepID=A0A0C9Z6T2_9AGAM|nr:hypothetical protein PISMIDRAFT_681058 [Pisolithus microcarpus 441]